MDDIEELTQSFAELNDPINDIIEHFVSSFNVKENTEILCDAIIKEGEIMDDIDGRLTDEFLFVNDCRMQKYLLHMSDSLRKNPKIWKRLDKYLNTSDRKKKFKLLVLIDQYLLREIIKLWPDSGLEDYLFGIV